MEHDEIPTEYCGWWRITETPHWPSGLDMIGPALISFTGYGDRLRMHVLLAHVTCKPNKQSMSFTWTGAWEFDQVSGSGNAKLGKDDRIKGVIKITNGDQSTFVAERTAEPDEPIQEPPSYRDKWRRRW
ncbi:hypothetical protein BH10PLA2_BH10PLA2_16540 [soil metagenome]